MKNRVIKLVSLLFVVGIISLNIHCLFGKQMNNLNLLFKNIEAFAADTESSDWGCGGNPTYVPNQTLKSDICLTGGTHLKCKSFDKVCCDPSGQTDCPKITIIK